MIPPLDARSLFDLTGRRAFVTGAGSGIGRAIASALAANGAKLLLADINAEALGETAAGIEGDVETMTLDIADGDAVDVALDRAAAEIVFANAGTTAGPGFGSPEGRIHTLDLDLWQSSMRVNLDGAFRTMRAAARNMCLHGRGSIVLTASISAMKTSPLPAYAYHAAKAAVAHVGRVAAKELGPHGIRVNVIAPGPFATNIAGGRLSDPARNHAFIETVPLGRVAQPHEIAGLALLLASDAGSYINGAVIPIDGGDSA